VKRSSLRKRKPQRCLQSGKQRPTETWY
jgi:hypothetical protein